MSGMAMHYEFLSIKTASNLYRTFIKAFSDYAVDMSYMSEEDFMNRAVKNGIDLEASVGVFDRGKMVGYTLIGIDEWKSDLSAYDIGTGIIKPYRGRSIAKKMFDFAVPRLQEKGVRKFVLEVLQKNEAAVRAYKKSGFQITREFDCFELSLKNAKFSKKLGSEIEIIPVKRDELQYFEDFLDWQPSWENSFASIQRIPDEVILLSAWYKGERIGLLVYYPALNWIMIILVASSYRRKGVATALLRNQLEQIQSRTSNVKLINVENSDTGLIAFLKQIGFVAYVKQFEMELVIA